MGGRQRARAVGARSYQRAELKLRGYGREGARRKVTWSRSGACRRGELEDGVPVARGAAGRELIFDELVREFRAAGAFGIHEVELAAEGGDDFGPSDRRFECAHGGGVRRSLEKVDMKLG